MTVGQRLNDIQSQMPSHCRLIAVSKTHPVETIMQAYAAGHRIFGENKVQEMVPKAEAMPKDAQWHMIGTLQRNKVKYIASFVSLIHSVDSPELLKEINKQAQKASRTIPCLLQIHIAKEDTKFGFSPNEALAFLTSDARQELKHIQITGLMGMATFTENTAQIREEFKALRSLFETIKSKEFPGIDMRELSMGMSSDYKIAIEEGSTLVRIGTAIFGSRH